MLPNPYDARRSMLVVGYNSSPLLKRHLLLRRIILPLSLIHISSAGGGGRRTEQEGGGRACLKRDTALSLIHISTIGTTDNEFRYNKNSFTATVGGKNIAITQVNNNIIPSNKDLTALKNALAANKCAVVCLRTSLTLSLIHI